MGNYNGSNLEFSRRRRRFVAGEHEVRPYEKPCSTQAFAIIPVGAFRLVNMGSTYASPVQLRNALTSSNKRYCSNSSNQADKLVNPSANLIQTGRPETLAANIEPKPSRERRRIEHPGG